MDLTPSSYEGLPAGKALDCTSMPTLNRPHVARLRWLWSHGRAVHLSKLDGNDLDLMVHGFIQTLDNGLSPSAVVTVTKRGVSYLNDNRQALIGAQRPHHELGRRLAAHLRAKGLMTWVNVSFANPDWSQLRMWGEVRPDVFACWPSMKASACAPEIYEVKVSRADFLADLAKPSKRQAYADLAEAVYYCSPEGVIRKDEVPEGFGLLCEVTEGQFEIRKKAARAKDFRIAADTALTLMTKRQVAIDATD